MTGSVGRPPVVVTVSLLLVSLELLELLELIAPPELVAPKPPPLLLEEAVLPLVPPIPPPAVDETELAVAVTVAVTVAVAVAVAVGPALLDEPAPPALFELVTLFALVVSSVPASLPPQADTPRARLRARTFENLANCGTRAGPLRILPAKLRVGVLGRPPRQPRAIFANGASHRKDVDELQQFHQIDAS